LYSSGILLLFIGIALVFGYLNGLHDSSSLVATMISSHAMSPRMALMLASMCEFVGPFLFGVAVAETIGRDIVSPEGWTLQVLMAAMVGAIAWNLLTWYLGLPASSSHALIGGLVGAAVIAGGLKVIHLAGLGKVLLALFLSPALGLALGYCFMKLILLLAQAASPKINWFFKRAQIFTAVILALSHGTNDAQKIMGIIALGLVAGQDSSGFQVPLWVIVVSAAALALGVGSGGWRLIRTLGGRIYRVRPVHGFASQTTSATVILGAALLGGPVSTTQVVSTAIMGVGSAERFRRVRWGVAREILAAWVITLPAAALVASVIYLLISQVWR